MPSRTDLRGLQDPELEMQGRFFLENTRNKGDKHEAEEAKPETKDDADKKIPTSIHLVRRADYLCKLPGTHCMQLLQGVLTLSLK
jgi:hypothetical protein